MTGKALLVFVCCAFLQPGAFAAPARSCNLDTLPPGILIDGRFEDWEETKPLAFNDEGLLKTLCLADDADYLFLKVELNRKINLQADNRITLYLDMDDDPNTGLRKGTLGAEAAFTFGERSGWVFSGEDTITIQYETLGLVTAPTMESTVFEIALAWAASEQEKALGFGTKPLRVLIADKAGEEATLTASYEPKRLPRPVRQAISLEKESPMHLRLVTHNVNRRHFHPEKRDAFSRVYQALQPDILLLQEAYDGTAREILDYFRMSIGAPLSGRWYAYKTGEEATVLISPFPASAVVPLGNSAAYILDLSEPYAGKLVLIALSMPCCGLDDARQAEADMIMAFIDNLKKGKTLEYIPVGTPVILAGDANLVRKTEQYTTLTEGRIQDTLAYGPGAPPDWDGSPFRDLLPYHLQKPLSFTWRGKGFFPGRMDFFIYSDSVLEIGRHFVFDTVGLPEEVLKRYNLREEDAPNTYKHQPVVADLILEQ